MQEPNFDAETTAEPQSSQPATEEVQPKKPPIGQRLAAFTAKQWVLFGITALTVLFMFIGLAFPVLHLQAFGLERTTLGFDVLFGNIPAAVQSVAAMLMAFVWLQLLATIAGIVLVVLALTVFSRKTAERVQLAVMIASAAFSFLYMIDGIAAVSASEIAGTTASYALFILVALFTAGYLASWKLLPETFAIQKREKRAEGDAAEQIRKYKELYDMGAITEAEYEKKKSELLNG